MKCPKCQTELPKTANFCLKCGERLNVGDQSPEPSPTPDAERKHVTALFSDLTGYTAMTEKLDPEETKENHYQHLFFDMAHSYYRNNRRIL